MTANARPGFRLSNGTMAVVVCAVVIIIDQVLKIWVKTSMYWGQDIEIFPWFQIKFIQNNGMAFGMELGSKLGLTLFRIVVVGLLTWYMVRLAQSKGVKRGYMFCLALITAGAAGNIIDCMFYGEIFSNPWPPQIATFVPWGHGYAGFMHGMVVDMLYFPLFSFVWPDWMPVVGGQLFTFFDPVFNFADAAITVGMFAVIIFYYRSLGMRPDPRPKPAGDRQK